MDKDSREPGATPKPKRDAKPPNTGVGSWESEVTPEASGGPDSVARDPDAGSKPDEATPDPDG